MLTGTGTGVGQLYRNAGPESLPADIGAQFGNRLMQEELVQKMKYTAPTNSTRETLTSGFDAELANTVNLDATQPVKYMTPLVVAHINVKAPYVLAVRPYVFFP